MLMSVRRIGRREYSLDRASRTIFLIIASVLVGALGPSSLSEGGGEESCLRRRAGVSGSEPVLDWGLLVGLLDEGFSCLLFFCEEALCMMLSSCSWETRRDRAILPQSGWSVRINVSLEGCGSLISFMWFRVEGLII